MSYKKQCSGETAWDLCTSLDAILYVMLTSLYAVYLRPLLAVVALLLS
jgi:hypothetical protein